MLRVTAHDWELDGVMISTPEAVSIAAASDRLSTGRLGHPCGAAAPIRCVSLVNVRDGRWSALSGVFTARDDEPLTELGRSIYHGNVLATDVLPSGKLLVVDRYIFGVVLEPFRFAYVNLVPGDGVDHPTTASTDEGVRGDWIVNAMLEPCPLSRSLISPMLGRFRSRPPCRGSPRSCSRTCDPRIRLLRGPDGSRVRILTSWSAFIRGRLAAEFTVEPSWWEK